MSGLQLALRRLRRTPIVSAAIILSLGLGVGVTTAVFSLVNSLLLRPLAVSDPQRLVTLSSNLALQHGLTTGLGWNLPIWLRMQERAGLFDGALAWTSGDITAGDGAERQSVYGLFTSGSFFTTLGVRAYVGRVYGVADDVQGGGPDGPVAVISDRFWKRRFGRDPRAIGSSLTLGQAPPQSSVSRRRTSMESSSVARSTWQFRSVSSPPFVSTNQRSGLRISFC